MITWHVSLPSPKAQIIPSEILFSPIACLHVSWDDNHQMIVMMMTIHCNGEDEEETSTWGTGNIRANRRDAGKTTPGDGDQINRDQKQLLMVDGSETCCTAVIRPYENPRALQVRTVFNKYLGIGRSNQKISKYKVHLFSNLASGRTLPTQSTGPRTIQLVPKHQFFTYISVSVAQIKKIKKTRYIYFQIWLLRGPSPPSQLVPNPFNWSPNTAFFLQISLYRSLKSTNIEC